MTKIVLLLSGLMLLALTSCTEKAEKPKVIYDSSKKAAVVPQVDTTQIEIADLPILISGTNYLIHPIGDVRVFKGSKGYVNSSSAGVSYTISNYSEFEITGYLRNFKFQQIDSDSISALTDKRVLIQSATCVIPSFDRNKQVMIYSLADMDTNKDGKLDDNDIKTLYISTVSGQRFTKLSVDYEEVIDWKFIENKGRIYFRTIEDTNKNGEFDKDDVVHYNYADLNNDEWKVTSYKPV
ncbi:CREC-EF hand family protein [Flavobacterium ardleyense]|uniref:hypothetical protein n=1 Tax=Flavobacterium ardleyense TaxID=2038737 RepID=UPI00298C3BC0|nr:hypothetical protein [Flavobacterium ardleyense]